MSLNLSYEKKLFTADCHFIAGVDEAGRGPLAGPVVAACVVIGKEFKIDKSLSAANDSKKLSPKKREELYEVIMSKIPSIGVGISTNKQIDKHGLSSALYTAMRCAIKKAGASPDTILVDGNRAIPGYAGSQQCIVKGDSKVFSIAAASIIAKVTRDRIMEKYSNKFPEYGFDVHKGYGTKHHFAMIKKYGPCPIHRLSFFPFKTTCQK